jgi:hypothetical protein
MTSAELLVDAFGRIRQVVALTPEQLAFRAGHISQALSVAGCLAEPRDAERPGRPGV